MSAAAHVPETGEVRHLLNYEVLRFLQLRRHMKEAQHQWRPQVDIQAAMLGAAALGPITLTGPAANPLVQREQAYHRLQEIKWAPKTALKYLLTTPAAFQTTGAISETLAALAGDNKADVGGSLRLTEGQKMAIVNACCDSQMTLQACLGERLPVRSSAASAAAPLTAYDHDRVAARVKELLPVTAAAAAAQYSRAAASAAVASEAAGDLLSLSSSASSSAAAGAGGLPAAAERCPAASEFLFMEADKRRQQERERERVAKQQRREAHWAERNAAAAGAGGAGGDGGWRAGRERAGSSAGVSGGAGAAGGGVGDVLLLASADAGAPHDAHAAVGGAAGAAAAGAVDVTPGAGAGVGHKRRRAASGADDAAAVDAGPGDAGGEGECAAPAKGWRGAGGRGGGKHK